MGFHTIFWECSKKFHLLLTDGNRFKKHWKIRFLKTTLPETNEYDPKIWLLEYNRFLLGWPTVDVSEILHHLFFLVKPYEKGNILNVNWCRISSIWINIWPIFRCCCCWFSGSCNSLHLDAPESLSPATIISQAVASCFQVLLGILNFKNVHVKRPIFNGYRNPKWVSIYINL